MPLTSNVRSIYPFQALRPQELSGLPAHSKAQAEEVRSISTERLVRPIARLTAELMARVDDALRLHLSL